MSYIYNVKDNIWRSNYDINLNHNKSGIYIIKNNINNKIYIGSSVKLTTRRKCHIRDLNQNKHHSISFQRFFNKYKNSNLELLFEILEFKPEADLIKTEQLYLNKLLPFSYRGFNMCKKAGSNLGCKKTTIWKKNMSKIMKGNKNNLGIKWTEESRLNRLSSIKLVAENKKRDIYIYKNDLYIDKLKGAKAVCLKYKMSMNTVYRAINKIRKTNKGYFLTYKIINN